MARAHPAPQIPSRPLTAEIVEIEERDGPRAAYAALLPRLQALRQEGRDVPQPLAHLEHRLITECCAMSQGR
jgi:hypothetical protein